MEKSFIKGFRSIEYTEYLNQQPHKIINPFFVSNILEYKTNIITLSESKFNTA